jgi:hypothetical protein
MALLAKFLGHAGDRAVGVQDAITDDQPDDFLGAAAIRFRAGRVGPQAKGAVLLERVEELIITLAAVAEEFGRPGHAGVFALAADEHGQPTTHDIVGSDVEGAAGA